MADLLAPRRSPRSPLVCLPTAPGGFKAGSLLLSARLRGGLEKHAESFWLYTHVVVHVGQLAKEPALADSPLTLCLSPRWRW